jgi:hypothetical protein
MAQMLRITNVSTAVEQRWILCGQLAGRWVREFQSSWGKESGASQGRRRIVDLTDVTFVDESGESLLRELNLGGAELVSNGGVETRDVLENLRAGGMCPIRKYLARPSDCAGGDEIS